jgi:molybdopterin-guanine dinucleotide biosynthesis protein A
MFRVPAYILAGGKSSRFGSDKARAQLAGQSLIEHVSKLIAGHASRVTAVAEVADKYADLKLRTISDKTPGKGPLGGLSAALADLAPAEPWLLLCSCDAAIIKPAWLDALLEEMARLDTQPQRAQAVAFRGDYWQPMPALYAAASAPEVGQRLQGEHRSMQRLLDALSATALPLPADWPDRWQINQPADLHHFRTPGL